MLEERNGKVSKKFGHDNPIKYAVVVSSINNFNARLLQLTLHEKGMVAAKSQLIQGPRIKLKNNSYHSSHPMKFVRTKQAQPGTELGSFIPVNENSIENHISSVGNIFTEREEQGYN